MRRAVPQPVRRAAGGAGFAWFVTEWNNPGAASSVVFTVGLVLYAACPPLVAHAALSYPNGRLGSRVEHGVVAVAYVGHLVVLGLGPPWCSSRPSRGAANAPTNLVAVTSKPALVASLNRAGVRLGVAWAIALAVLAVWRLVRSTPAARRVKAPVLVPAVGLPGRRARHVVHLRVDRGFVSNDALDRRLWLVQAVDAVLVALGVAVEWVRARRARSAVAAMVVDLAQAPPREGSAKRWPARSAIPSSRSPIRSATDATSTRMAGGRRSDRAGQGSGDDGLVRDGETIALLVHRADLLGDPRLVEEVASAAGLAFEQRATPGRGGRPAGGAAHVAGAARRGVGPRAPAAGARPPRRRSATARRADAWRCASCAPGSTRRPCRPSPRGWRPPRPSSTGPSTSSVSWRRGSIRRCSSISGWPRPSRRWPRRRPRRVRAARRAGRAVLVGGRDRRVSRRRRGRQDGSGAVTITRRDASSSSTSMPGEPDRSRRPRRSRRRARRHVDDRPGPYAASGSGRSSRAGSHRRRLDARPRGPGPAARRGRLRDRRHGRERAELLRPVGVGRARRRHRRHQDATDAHRRRDRRRAGDPAHATRASACWCSRSTSSPPTPCACSPRCPSGPATCSRIASPTSPCSSTRCGASPKASA